MREWVVGGAVIEGPMGVLLVRNRRRDGSFDWSPPGGVIDPGESVIDGLTREVLEETGLQVTVWSEIVYEISASAPIGPRKETCIPDCFPGARTPD